MHIRHRSTGKESPKSVAMVLKAWKRFLRGAERNVGAFSQHVFQKNPNETKFWHEMIGGEFDPQRGFVILIIGPIVIFGMTERIRRTLAELRVLDKSRICPSGGYLGPLGEWTLGVNIIRELCAVSHR